MFPQINQNPKRLSNRRHTDSKIYLDNKNFKNKQFWKKGIERGFAILIVEYILQSFQYIFKMWHWSSNRQIDQWYKNKNPKQTYICNRNLAYDFLNVAY